jgi:flagellar hook-associated protein 2
MAGIQISGLLSNSAFDWKAVVDQLVAIETIPITNLEKQQAKNTEKIEALATLQTAMQDLKDSLQAMRADEVFSARTVSSNTANTTWKSSSVTGAAVGSYTVAVEKLATAARYQGAANISSGLAATSDVTGVTISTMRTATAVTAGTFTVDGQQITVALTDSLQDVFDKITTAVPAVTAGYNATTDAITLTRSSGELILGAANDTSNFLSVMKLVNNGGSAVTSSASLGTLKVASPLVSAGLSTAVTAVDGSGNGSFSLNGVAISYNLNTDSIGGLINRINGAGAGVTASYDSANDRVVLANKTTGDTGITATEAAGGLLDALGLTSGAGGALVRGTNAEFRINGGALLLSRTNTLESSVHGIDGLSVTVNSETTQTLQVESDAATMNTAIEGFIEKFNAVQDFIETNSKVTVTGTTVEAALLADNREIQSWASQLQRKAFDQVSGVTGSITRLERLGIDFDSASGKLAVKDSGKLATALGDFPEDVEDFFLRTTTGFVPKMYDYLATIISADRKQQSNLSDANTELDDQIETLQTRLAATREQLTTSFIRMLDAQSSAQSQNTYLTNTFFKNSS